MIEGDDLYGLLQKFQPTIFVKDKPAEKFWEETVPSHCAKLEALIKHETGFTSTGTTTGELYLFSMLHQMACVSPDFMAGTPKLQKWYSDTKALPKVAHVLAG